MTAPALDAAALGELELPDPDRQLHRVGDLWADRTVILVFLRHFG